jgi:hypothetical protein
MNRYLQTIIMSAIHNYCVIMLECSYNKNITSDSETDIWNWIVSGVENTLCVFFCPYSKFVNKCIGQTGCSRYVKCNDARPKGTLLSRSAADIEN